MSEHDANMLPSDALCVCVQCATVQLSCAPSQQQPTQSECCLSRKQPKCNSGSVWPVLNQGREEGCEEGEVDVSVLYNEHDLKGIVQPEIKMIYSPLCRWRGGWSVWVQKTTNSSAISDCRSTSHGAPQWAQLGQLTIPQGSHLSSQRQTIQVSECYLESRCKHKLTNFNTKYAGTTCWCLSCSAPSLWSVSWMSVLCVSLSTCLGPLCSLLLPLVSEDHSANSSPCADWSSGPGEGALQPPPQTYSIRHYSCLQCLLKALWSCKVVMHDMSDGSVHGHRSSWLLNIGLCLSSDKK